MVTVSPEGAWLCRTPRLSVSPPGAGDLTTAVFLANLLNGHGTAEALARTTSSVYAIVAATVATGGREMPIVANQHALAEPAMEFEVIALA
jgi:pyridoxine kinase